MKLLVKLTCCHCAPYEPQRYFAMNAKQPFLGNMEETIFTSCVFHVNNKEYSANKQINQQKEQ